MLKFLIILFLLPFRVFSQEVNPVSATDFPDAIVSAPETYDLESVLQYNSDADLFMEFGFVSLMVQEIVWADAKLKIEVYRLDSPEGAFGSYALSVINCLQRDTAGPCDCNNIYQYQAAYGNLYILITSESGSAAARSRHIPSARAIMQRNPQQNLVLPEPFSLPHMEKWRKNLVYIQGPVGLQNSLYPWQEIFLTVRFGMYAIYQASPANGIYLARIRFETAGDMRRFLTLSGLMQDGNPVSNMSTNDGLYREFLQLDDQTIYFLQSQEPWPIDALLTGGH